MIIKKVVDVKEENLDNGGEIKKTSKRLLISEEDGAPNMRLRHFTIQPGGHSPWHQHDWEHENFFIKGKGVLRSGDKEIEVGPEMFAYVAPGEKHQFKNPFDEPFEFLCLVPIPED